MESNVAFSVESERLSAFAEARFWPSIQVSETTVASSTRTSEPPMNIVRPCVSKMPGGRPSTVVPGGREPKGSPKRII